MKERYRLDDPFRGIFPGDVDGARKAMRRGQMITAFCVGFYGQLRNWMGMERLSYAFYD